MTFDRELISNGNPMESIVGFSRAVRVAPLISVGGTAPVDTIIAVDRFVRAERLVELEADAIIGGWGGRGYVHEH